MRNEPRTLLRTGYSVKGLVEIVPIFHTVFAHVYHYAISELCKGLCTITMGSGTSPHVLRFSGFGHRREHRRLEYAFLTNAAATVRSVGAVSVRACVRP